MTSAERSLETERDWLSDAVDLGGLGVWSLELEGGGVQLNSRARDLYGVSEDEDLALSAWRRRVRAPDRLVLELEGLTPEAAEIEVLICVDLPNQPPLWVLERARVSEWRDGAARRLVGVSRDVTRQHESEERRRELINELQHRIKNMLAVVRSLARRTADGSRDLEDFSAHFEGRLAALARVQTALARSLAGRVDLEGLLREELLHTARADDEPVQLAGPSVELRPKLAEALAVALHELCANAVKFGALTGDGGDLRVDWRVEPGSPDHLILDWTESGTPTLSEPGPAGFGLEFLQAGLAYEVGGRADIRFPPGGFTCRIRVPLSEGP